MPGFIYNRDGILEEIDPEKLHDLATRIIKENVTYECGNLSRIDNPTTGLGNCISFAFFLEARAAYLNTKRIGKRLNVID